MSTVQPPLPHLVGDEGEALDLAARHERRTHRALGRAFYTTVFAVSCNLGVVLARPYLPVPHPGPNLVGLTTGAVLFTAMAFFLQVYAMCMLLGTLAQLCFFTMRCPPWKTLDTKTQQRIVLKPTWSLLAVAGLSIVLCCSLVILVV